MNTQTSATNTSHTGMLANLRNDRARCKSVLLVEDDPMVRGIVHDMLVGDNYQVITAADGHDALNVWERRQSEIGILITDVQMPGMSAITLARQLTTHKTSFNALYISVYPDSISEANLIKIPLLQKPFSLHALSTT